MSSNSNRWASGHQASHKPWINQSGSGHALFYHTAAPAKDFSGDETTYYRVHGKQAGVLRKGRFLIFRGLMTISRNISVVAHIVNPNLGVPQ
jgi:hypothetical protein